MKQLLALALLMTSSAHAQTNAPAMIDPTLFQSTSFFRLSNGDFETVSPQTRDFAILDQLTFKPIMDPLTGKAKIETGQTYIYDVRNPLAKIVGSGSNYAVLSDKTLVTFSSTWDKPIVVGKIDFEVDTYGGSFMIKKGTREIVTISATGYVTFSTGIFAPAIRIVGGNFFIDASNDLWTISARGAQSTDPRAYVYHLTAGKYPLAFLPGGNYFYQQDGTLITIGYGGLPSLPYALSAKPTQLGGNYYIGDDQTIYSIGYDGAFYKNGATLGKIKTLGFSYAIFDNSSFIAVDGQGIVHTDAVRVSTTKTKYIKVNQIKETIDPMSVYTPNSRKN